jgi:hypothetical protein
MLKRFRPLVNAVLVAAACGASLSCSYAARQGQQIPAGKHTYFADMQRCWALAMTTSPGVQGEAETTRNQPCRKEFIDG